MIKYDNLHFFVKIRRTIRRKGQKTGFLSPFFCAKISSKKNMNPDISPHASILFPPSYHLTPHFSNPSLRRDKISYIITHCNKKKVRQRAVCHSLSERSDTYDYRSVNYFHDLNSVLQNAATNRHKKITAPTAKVAVI